MRPRLALVPPGVPWQFTLRMSTTSQDLRMARRLVAAAAREAGANDAVAFDLEVAVGEALENAHVHAYGRRRGKLEVELQFDGTTLGIAVHDSGKPMATAMQIPTTLPPPGAGRGLYLIGQLMDEAQLVHPDRRGRGTAVHMRKRIR